MRLIRAIAAALAGGDQYNCCHDRAESAADAQASLPVRVELAHGGYLTSLVGYGLTYNTLDNNKNPTNGLLVSFGQDFAGLGGDVNYMRSVVDFRSYYEVVSDLVGIVHLQGGNMIGFARGRTASRTMCACSTTSRWVPTWSAASSRRHRSARHHARHGERCARRHELLGRQPGIPISVLLPAQGCRLPRRRVRRFRSGVGLQGRDVVAGDRRNQRHYHHQYRGAVVLLRQLRHAICRHAAPRVSVGASLIWDSPFGPLRFDFAYPILKQSYDRTQFFQFGGGTQF